MITKKINLAIIAGLIACFSSFPVIAEKTLADANSPEKVLAETRTKESAVAEPSRPVQAEAASKSGQTSNETPFELLSLEGILSFVMTIMFFLVLIKGKIIKTD